MKVGYVQASPIFGQKTQNFQQVEKKLVDIKADLIVLPELFSSGYAFISKKEVELIAETDDGKTAQFLMGLAKKTDAIIVGGFAEKDHGQLYNSAMIVSKNGVIGTYRKIHLYYKEKLWFSPGNKQLEIFRVKNTSIGIMICFDWIFPEMMRSLALLGADIIAHPANLVLPYCQKAMVTRCLENRVYAITSNRVGQEKRGPDDFKFTGASQITSYNGEVLSSAPIDTIHADFVSIDIKKARNKKLNEFNDIFEDRRKKFYVMK